MWDDQIFEKGIACSIQPFLAVQAALGCTALALWFLWRRGTLAFAYIELPLLWVFKEVGKYVSLCAAWRRKNVFGLVSVIICISMVTVVELFRGAVEIQKIFELEWAS